MGRDAEDIWFRSVSPFVFQLQPVNTLEELKSAILRNMEVVGSMLVRRVAYRLLNLFSPNQFKFNIFWVDSDAHVRAMFELHHRYGSRDVMELLTEMHTVNVDAGGSTSSSQGGPGAIFAALIQFATPEVGNDDSDEDFVGNTNESSESSDGSEFVPESQTNHFHTLNLDDMVEEQSERLGGSGKDYDIDGGSEFRVGHQFSTREAVHMAVKNYNIRRASEYRVIESDPYKYVCRCKRYDAAHPDRALGMHISREVILSPSI
ncbi:hypothetical protein PIB30_095392 [Stylosanthes scabra]|uniref:Transposase MuDR plant domain-containing protein n=1 Tax=Stylosanthes scabra TaxID=79078 RepID=A0ABU6TX63_9FABA|nr:hypothetical protein [Stylosanthes scabra]